jgi:S-adenosylmethionine decarboxylase
MTSYPPSVGNHLLIDLWADNGLADLDFVQQVCEQAAIATGATVIDRKFHHFGEGSGITGVVVLAESHLSIHTWPESGFAAIDVFVCGNCDPELAIPVLMTSFDANKVESTTQKRGLNVVSNHAA